LASSDMSSSEVDDNSHLQPVVKSALVPSMIEDGRKLEGFSATPVLLNTLEQANVRPARNTSKKLIHFVRHAEGFHNVAGRKDFENYKSEEFEDAILSPTGHEQCKELATNQSEFAGVEGRVQLVVTSVMRRCLQTATESFPGLIGKVPWVASELCREQSGGHPCDRRRPLSESRTGYDHVNFDELTEEEDPLYYAFNNGEREPLESCIERSKQFLEWLFAREEVEVVVCTHSAILAVLIPLLVEGKFEGYKNAELRSYVVVKKD
jgi:broad specificity phosphatase PhoE